MERLAARPDAGGRASAAPAPGAKGAAGWTDRGFALAQASDEAPDETPNETQNETPGETPDRAGTPSGEDGPDFGRPRALPVPGPDMTDRTFEGSAKRAGPDLTLPEEEQLITGGWD